MSLILHLDASGFLGSLATNSSVSGWQDLTGNYTAIASGGNMPTLRHNMVNGWPSVSFDGVNDFMDFNNGGSPLIPSSGDFTMMFSISGYWHPANASVPFGQNKSTLTNNMLLLHFSSPVPALWHTSAFHASANDLYGASVSGNFNILTYARSGDAFQMFVNGRPGTGYQARSTISVSQVGNTIGGYGGLGGSGYNQSVQSFSRFELAQMKVWNEYLPLHQKFTEEQAMGNRVNVTIHKNHRMLPSGDTVPNAWTENGSVDTIHYNNIAPYFNKTNNDTVYLESTVNSQQEEFALTRPQLVGSGSHLAIYYRGATDDKSNNAGLDYALVNGGGNVVATRDLATFTSIIAAAGAVNHTQHIAQSGNLAAHWNSAVTLLLTDDTTAGETLLSGLEVWLAESFAPTSLAGPGIVSVVVPDVYNPSGDPRADCIFVLNSGTVARMGSTSMVGGKVLGRQRYVNTTFVVGSGEAKLHNRLDDRQYYQYLH